MPKTAPYAEKLRVELDHDRAQRNQIEVAAKREGKDAAARAASAYAATDEHYARQRKTGVDDKAVELSKRAQEAADAFCTAEREAQQLDRRIAQMETLLNAESIAESTLTEARANAEEAAGLVARNANLKNARQGLCAKERSLEAQAAVDRDAAAERDVAALIAGEEVPDATPSTASAELARVRAAIAHADKTLNSTAERIKELRQRAGELSAVYATACFHKATLEHEGAMAEIAPLRARLDAARLVANLNPAAAVPIDEVAVQRAMQAIRDALPRLPPEPPADESDSAETLSAAAPSADREIRGVA